MVTKRDLMGVRELIRIQRTIAERMESIRASVTLSSPSLDGMPHGGEYHDRMAEYVAKMDAIQWEYAKLETRLQDEIMRIETEVRMLKPNQCAVIWMRYIDGMSWKRISRELHYSASQVYELHKAGLKRLSTERPE